MAEGRNGGTAEQESSRSNGYLSTSFMVHADDDTTLIIYSIDRSLEGRLVKGCNFESQNCKTAGYGNK
jgi:hypothetical protein